VLQEEPLPVGTSLSVASGGSAEGAQAARVEAAVASAGVYAGEVEAWVENKAAYYVSVPFSVLFVL